MKLRFYLGIFLAVIATIWANRATFSHPIHLPSQQVQDVQAKERANKDQVTFFCGQISDQTNDENLPTTLAWVPQKQKNIPIIFWKSNYFAAWEPQTRCETVSPKFQTFYQDGRLNYLTNGTNQGYPVICAVTSKEEQCNSENQLFQIKPNDDSGEVLRRLMDIVEGKKNAPLYQSSDSGKQVYIPMTEFLLNAEAVEEQSDLTLK